jgi:hypothetical protein
VFRQPVERHVVEDLVARQLAVQPSLEDARDEPGLAGAVAVVDRERGEVDRGVREPIQGLRTRRHDQRVGDVLRVERAQLLEGALLLGRQAGRRRVAVQERRGDLGRRGAGHVGVDAEPLGRRLDAHRLRDGRPPVAALGHEPAVAEALHQVYPGACGALGIPAGGGRLGGESVAGQRGDHKMEGVVRAPAVRRGIRERLDDLSCSTIEPGHRWVTIIGSASSCWSGRG